MKLSAFVILSKTRRGERPSKDLEVERRMRRYCFREVERHAFKWEAYRNLMEPGIIETKENEFMTFLRANSANLRMNVPTPGAIRETIEFLAGSVPNWTEETSPEQFVKILVKRYPELRFEWTDGDGSAGDVDDEPATEKQIAYLKTLGAPVPKILGIREASDLIEKWKNRVSDAQKRRLDFYRLDYEPNITREQANALIDSYKAQHPESEGAYQKWKAESGLA